MGIKKKYEKPFLIASSYSVRAFIGIFLFSLAPIIIIYDLIKKFNNIGIEGFSIIYLISMFFGLCFFILLSFIILKGFMRVSIDLKNKIINIQRTKLKIYYKQIPFDDVKSIIFTEEEMLSAEGHSTWFFLMEINGINNDILFKMNVSNAFNYELLEELCSNYFKIDYIVEYLNM